MTIKEDKFLCAFNAQGWERFNAKKLEQYAKRHLKDFQSQDTQENLCEDCGVKNDHIFHTLQLVDWTEEAYELDFAQTFELDRYEIDSDVIELTIIQCSNCGNWRVAL